MRASGWYVRAGRRGIPGGVPWGRLGRSPAVGRQARPSASGSSVRTSDLACVALSRPPGRTERRAVNSWPRRQSPRLRRGWRSSTGRRTSVSRSGVGARLGKAAVRAPRSVVARARRADAPSTREPVGRDRGADRDRCRHGSAGGVVPVVRVARLRRVRGGPKELRHDRRHRGCGDPADAPVLTAETLQASLDIPFLALVLGALAVELGPRRRPAVVIGMLAVAGLLRPEAWLLSAAYLAWIWRTLPRRAVRALVVAAASAPVIWLLADWVLAGDPLYSLTRTQAGGAFRSSARRGLGRELGPGSSLASLIGTPVLWCALASCVALTWLLYERARLVAVILLAGFTGFVVIGVAGLPILTRYLLLPASMIALFAGGAVSAWRLLPAGGAAGRGRAVARWWQPSRSSSRSRAPGLTCRARSAIRARDAPCKPISGASRARRCPATGSHGAAA